MRQFSKALRKLDHVLLWILSINSRKRYALKINNIYIIIKNPLILILGYSAGAAEEIRTRQMKRSRIVDIPPSSQFTPEQVRKDQSQLRPGICSNYFLSLEKLTRKKAEQFSKLLSCSRHRTTKFPNSESPIFTTKFLF